MEDAYGKTLKVGDWVYYIDTLIGAGYGVVTEFRPDQTVWVNTKVGSGKPPSLMIDDFDVGFYFDQLEKLPKVKSKREQIILLKKLHS